MKPILSAEEMRACDQATIEKHKVPSLVLMERAAGAVANFIIDKYPESNQICVLCGPGNNGGDGVAIARLLYLAGRQVITVLMSEKEKFSGQLKEEIEIAESYGMDFVNGYDESAIGSSDLYVDAMFGIGLTRGLSGDYLQAAKKINESEKPVVAVDIPSGYHTDCGKLLGEAGVIASHTITFAYMKKGLVLGECKGASGEVHVADVGIYLDDTEDKAMVLEEEDLKILPKRKPTANKGSCGKILIIGGSENIYGALYLSAKAALTAGAGLTKVFTHKNNIESIRQSIPEAMFYGYEGFEEDKLIESIDWADVILMGPGLSTGKIPEEIVTTVLEKATVPLIIDADGINICANKKEALIKYAKDNPVIITPHLKEMERLTDIPVKDINYDMESIAYNFSLKTGITVVLKNFTTVIAAKEKIFYSTSGNEALATPGSGDVLAGIITSFVAQGFKVEDCGAIGAFFHGLCGKLISQDVGIKSLLASDIIEGIKIINVLT
ncbi:MAG: NAD(P)H-hydrate dehydratase [Pseudobutyrivibrio sp.]|nr:NAD(P)H-hydrate dehydratase [Pseudobutyrivibrio sp.]